MPPQARPKQFSLTSFFKPVVTDEERAAQRACEAAESQRFAEHVQRQKQKQERGAEEQTRPRQALSALQAVSRAKGAAPGIPESQSRGVQEAAATRRGAMTVISSQNWGELEGHSSEDKIL